MKILLLLLILLLPHAWGAVEDDVYTNTVGDTLCVGAGACRSQCALTTVHCVGPGLEFDTFTQADSAAFQAAANVAVAGDTIAIAGGDYYHAQSTGTSFMTIAGIGSAGLPITVTPFIGERAHIHGWGYTEEAFSPAQPNERLIVITGDYVHLKDLDMSYSSRYTVDISGSYNLVEGLTIAHSWEGAVVIHTNGGDDTTGNVIRYNFISYSRHTGGGIWMLIDGGIYATPIVDTVIEYNVLYRHGFNPVTGRVVEPASGDAAGGGNSNGITMQKDCAYLPYRTQFGIPNACPGTIMFKNILWSNADNNIITGGPGLLMGNIMLDGGFTDAERNQACVDANGPTGYVGCANARNHYTFPSNQPPPVLPEDSGGPIGPVPMVGNFLSNGRRTGLSMVLHSTGIALNTTSLLSGGMGIYMLVYEPWVPTGGTYIRNNYMSDSVGFDMGFQNGYTNPPQSNNWAQDGVNSPAYSGSTPASLLVDFDYRYPGDPLDIPGSIKQKIDTLYQLYSQAFAPAVGSPLIDRGVFDPTWHCPTAGYEPAESEHCLYWEGTAPDIGAFEYRQ